MSDTSASGGHPGPSRLPQRERIAARSPSYSTVTTAGAATTNAHGTSCHGCPLPGPRGPQNRRRRWPVHRVGSGHSSPYGLDMRRVSEKAPATPLTHGRRDISRQAIDEGARRDGEVLAGSCIQYTAFRAVFQAGPAELDDRPECLPL